MLTKTKIALAAVLIAGTASAAMADPGFDPNLANRYPAYADPIAAVPHAAFHSEQVALHHSRKAALSHRHHGNYSGQSEFDVDRNDRASSPYAGGGF